MDYSLSIWSIATFIESNVKEDIKYEDLEKITGLSYLDLRCIIKSNTGVSLSNYILNRRIAHAAFDLIYTSKTITGVAFEYSFNSYDAFVRAFKRITGKSPKKFRQGQYKVGHISNIYLGVNNDLDSVYDLYEKNNLFRVGDHTKRMLTFAVNLSQKYDIPTEKVRTAAVLHDISGIVANDLRIQFCESTGIELLKEEIMYPMLSHQKVSRKIAEELYLIHDSDILNAIGCHTTLISNPSILDLIVFISDKIEWDQDGEPPYKSDMLEALDHSLEASALCYIDFVLNAGSLKVPHPWLLEAKEYLGGKIYD